MPWLKVHKGIEMLKALEMLEWIYHVELIHPLYELPIGAITKCHKFSGWSSTNGLGYGSRGQKS